MRVLLDATPLLGRRTGIGRYVAGLVAALAARTDVEPVLVAFTARGQAQLRRIAPPGVAVRGGPVPARVLRAAWTRGSWPPVELLAGPAEVVHGTNFVLPPARSAAGVLTVHDLAFRDPEMVAPAERDLAGLVARALADGAVVCTPTRAVADQVVQHYAVEPDRLVVTPLGVDQGWFRVPRPATGRPYLVAVGAAGPRKGVGLMLAAHAALGPAAPELVLAGASGSGPLPAGVRRTGWLAEPDLQSLVAGAHAVVLTSVDEGFGLPALEAMAAGVPVVCADVAALAESTGGHAVLCARTAAAVADGIRRAPGVDVVAAREHAATMTWARTAETTVRAYRKALSS